MTFVKNQNNSEIFYPLVGLLVIGLILLFALISMILYSCGRNRELKRLKKLQEMLKHSSNDQECISQALPLHEQIERLPYDVNFEIQLERLIITKVLSSGQYGRVFAGKLRSKTENCLLDVAVKGPKDPSKFEHMKAIIDELRILIAIGIHPNVLGIIGAVTENIRKGSDVYVIMELCDTDLRNYLLNHRIVMLNRMNNTNDYNDPTAASQYLVVEDSSQKKEIEKNESSGYISMNKTRDNNGITTDDLLAIAYQVANGMEYLASKMCVHRDLAARNVLLTNRRIVRIADFGLARQCDESIYHVQSFNLPLPYKSIAPECLSEFNFTEKSDVWSYGILLWEIFSFGDIPYKDFDSAEKLTKFHENGGRLKPTENIPDEIMTLMRQCWQMKPIQRPNFTECRYTTENKLKSVDEKLFHLLQNKLANELNEMKGYEQWRDGQKLRKRLTKKSYRSLKLKFRDGQVIGF